MQWRQRVQESRARGLEDRIHRDFMSRTQGLPERYRYQVLIHIPAGDGKPRSAFTVIIDSPDQLNNRQIREAAFDMFRRVSGISPPGRRGWQPNQNTAWTLLSAERRIE